MTSIDCPKELQHATMMAALPTRDQSILISQTLCRFMLGELLVYLAPSIQHAFPTADKLLHKVH